MKYSVEEIDEMRESVASMLQRKRIPYSNIEERLRTYMLNGTTPDELLVAASPKETQEYLKSHPEEIANFIQMQRKVW